MKLRTSILGTCAAAGLVAAMSDGASAQISSPLTVSRDGGHVAHFFPTHQLAKQLGLITHKGATPSGGPLIYHGGPVMQPTLRFYVIYWQPPTLQSGAATTMSTGYKGVQTAMVRGYFGHDISANNTQYYQGSSTLTYINGQGALNAPYMDTQPYPTSQCAASIGANCITDAQLAAEVQRVVTANGWTPGFDKMFLVFTSQGEGSCFDNTVNYCSTETNVSSPYFCAYHSYTGASNNIIYSNEPFGSPTYCKGSGTQPNLNSGGPQADPASTAASHEMTEAITDPQLNAWFDSSGSEIGDICAYNYGTNTWDSVHGSYLANQMWGGRFFELQTEYDNHTTSCVLTGP